MMKRMIFALLALWLLLSLFACKSGDGDVPQGYLDAGTEGVEYRFFYPDTWLLDRHDPGMTSVYFSDTDFSNVSVTVFVPTERYESASQYAQSYYFEHLQGTFPNVTPERNQDGSYKFHTVTIDGVEGARADYAATVDGTEFAFRSYFVLYNGNIYTVTYTAKRDLFDSHTDAVQGMIEQMRFQ